MKIAHPFSLRAGKYFLAALICNVLFLCAAELHSQTFTTKNQWIWANVDGQSGFVTVLIPPGRPPYDPQLSFPNKSYFTCSIAGTYFTNNEVIPSPPANTKKLTDGVTTKIADTVRTIWSNKNGVDIIQDIYPVAFTKSGQIVYKWKFKNNTASPISIGCQYLQDIQITDPHASQPNSSDGPTILTKWSYKPLWQQFPNPVNGQSLPWFYIGFLHTLPSAPSLDPGLSGMGYMDYGAPLNLIKPFRMTIGDWYVKAITIFGQGSWPFGTAYGTDNAVLVEFAPRSIPAGQTIEVGRTSYGTGEYEKCVGSLFSLVFYPHHLVWTKSNAPPPGFYTPNPIHIEKFVVNPDKVNASANTKITLTVGDDMTLSDSVCNSNFGKSQTMPTSGPGMFIGPGDVGYFDWWACTSPVLFCTGADIDSLIFTATCGVCPPGFLNSEGELECDQQIVIDCAEADIDAPEFTEIAAHDTTSIHVDDARTTDRGLKSITWARELGTDTTKVIVLPVKPAILPCFSDKLDHIVKVIQLDSTIGGCYDFTFEDCLGHRSFDTICMTAKIFVAPDSFCPNINVSPAPVTNPTSLTVDINDIHFNDPPTDQDPNKWDRGIDSVWFTNNRGIVTPGTLRGECAKTIPSFKLSVRDTLQFDTTDCVTINATDCYGNICSLTWCYTAPHDTTHSSAPAPQLYMLSLEANHPNPFSHITTFNYTIAEYGIVKLYFYDELGREVARIFDGAKGQGTYSVDFDGSKLPGGSYIVRLESAGSVISRKVIIER